MQVRTFTFGVWRWRWPLHAIVAHAHAHTHTHRPSTRGYGRRMDKRRSSTSRRARQGEAAKPTRAQQDRPQVFRSVADSARGLPSLRSEGTLQRIHSHSALQIAVCGSIFWFRGEIALWPVHGHKHGHKHQQILNL